MTSAASSPCDGSVSSAWRWATVVADHRLPRRRQELPLHLPAERDPDLRRPQAHACPTARRSATRWCGAAGRVRTPLLETVSRMDMRLFMVEVDGHQRLLEGRHPARRARHRQRQDRQRPRPRAQRGGALPGHDPAADRGGRAADAGGRAARGAGPAHARGGERGPPQVRGDPASSNAQDDFDKLGLELDVLKVQHVSDEQQYLQNLGRARIALMIRDAQNAENEANQKIAEEQAAARQRAESAQKQAEATGARRSGTSCAASWRKHGGAGQVDRERGRHRRRDRARHRRAGAAAPARASSRSCACECDVVLPAEAARLAAEARARGEAAPLDRERQGRGRGAARWCPRSGRRPGQSGREVYLLQQLRSFVEAAVGARDPDRGRRAEHRGRRRRPGLRGLRGQLPGRGGAGDGGDGARGRASTCGRCSGSKEAAR